MPNTQKENWKRELKIWVLDMKISRIYNLNVSSLLTKHFMVSSIFFAKVNSNRFTKLDKTQWRLDICCTYIYTISQWKIDKEPVERIFFVYNLHYCFICWACRSSLQFILTEKESIENRTKSQMQSVLLYSFYSFY